MHAAPKLAAQIGNICGLEGVQIVSCLYTHSSETETCQEGRLDLKLYHEYVLREFGHQRPGAIINERQELKIGAEYTGLYGFIAQSGYNAVFPDINQGKQVYYQGSRQIDNFSRRYYERELGAGIGPSPSMKEHFGYTEPFRRFVQRESFTPQANEIRNARSPRPACHKKSRARAPEAEPRS